MAENDEINIITQFLAETSTAVPDVDCLPLSSLQDINEAAEEIDLNESISDNLPVDLEADDMFIEAGYSIEQHQNTLLAAVSGTDMDSGEVMSNSQQSESSVYRDAFEDSNVKDMTTADLSQTTETMMRDGSACMHVQNNNMPVQYSDDEVFPSSCSSAVVTTAAISECSGEQQLLQDVVDVIDADRSDLCSKSPISVYNDSSQTETQNEQQAMKSLLAVSSLSDEQNTCMMNTGINSTESVDDVHNSSPLVQCSSEAENISAQSWPEDEDSVKHLSKTEVPVACTEEKSISLEECDSFLTNDVPDESDHIYLELSPITDPEVDEAQSVSPSHASQQAMQVESEVDKSGFESVELSTSADELLNDVIISDVADQDKLTAESNQTLKQNCEEVAADSFERCMTEEDISKTGDTTLSTGADELLNAVVASDVAVPHEPTTERDQTSKQNCEDIAGDSFERCTTEEHLSKTDDAQLSTGAEEILNAIVASVMAVPSEPTAENDQTSKQNCEEIAAHSLERCSTEEHISKTDDTQISTGAEELSDAIVASVMAVPSELTAENDQTSKQNCEELPAYSFEACTTEEDISKTDGSKLSTGAVELLNAVTVSDVAFPQKPTAESDQTSNQNREEIPALSFERCTTEEDTAKTDDAIREHRRSGTHSPVICEMEAVSSSSDDSHEEDVNQLSGSKVTPEQPADSASTEQPEDSASTVVLVCNASSTLTNSVTESLELGSRREANKPSSVVILKNTSASTHPPNTFIPHSSSLSVLLSTSQCTASVAAGSVSSSVAGTLGVSQYVMPSWTEPKSSATINYRPAAAVAMTVGKNLVTEFVFREIVAHEKKWKSASDVEKVPLYC